MKVSQATNKIRGIKRNYTLKCTILFTCVIIFLGIIFLLYYGPNHFNVPWKNFFLSKLSLIYLDNRRNQIILEIIVFVILTFLGVLLSFRVYKKNDKLYQAQFMEVICNELELNEIYEEKKRLVDDSSSLEFIFETLNLTNIDKDYLFTFKSMFPLSFYQLFSAKKGKNDNSLLIKCRNDKKINGFVQIRFEPKFSIDTYNEKGIFQYNFQNTRKYQYDVYINSSMQQRTYKIVDHNVMKTLMQLRQFTNVNLVITITDDLYYVWIPGWELKLTDHLFDHLDGDGIDKKVSVFTELIDEVTDLYIYLLSEEELWVEKW